MKIPADVLAVLDNAEVTDNALRLTGGQLDRNLYVRTNKVIETAGGKWNRKAGAHLFTTDPADVIEQILLTGEITAARDFGYFPTPPNVVDRLIELADLEPGMSVLEPSAGRGAIAGPVAALGCVVDTVELLPENAAHLTPELTPKGLLVVGDFLTMTPPGFYDRVVMNPPFARQDDVRHVMHAHQFLKPGGLLVSVMSNGVTFRAGRLMDDFNALVGSVGGLLEPLPEGSFTVSGTGVNTVIAVLPASA